ncbi:hypothetical protein H4S07_000728 [Coemansia furcata]|uniref:Uncharacterized protein n=1 Tax=Coemansia furcata TaxID=417177 RepID=A0ACC1LPW6_9FUNG|nr:hypothetical protein H4S07_000728 [Coemansia furcata]
MEPPPFDKELSKYPAQPPDSGADDCQVQTNYSRVEITAKHIYVYQVSITNVDAPGDTQQSSQVTEPLVRSEVFRQAAITKKHVYFDGKDYAYAARSLHKYWDGEELTTKVQSSSIPELEVACQLEVKIKALRRYDTKELERYCAGDASVPDGYIQGFMFAVDAIVRSCSTPQLEDVGGRRLSGHRAVCTPWGFDVWWEYRLTMRPGRGALFANIGAKSVPVINVANLGQLFRLFFEKKAAQLKRKNKSLEMRDWEAFAPVVRGLQVMVNGALVTITGLSTTAAGQMMVGMGDPLMPCALTVDKQAVPLALCELPAGKRQVQAVVGAWQRDDFLRVSAVEPSHRQEVLAHGMRLLAQESADLAAFGIKIGATLERVGARVFDAPRIMLRKGGEEERVATQEGRWEMNGRRVVGPAQLRAWTVLVFGHEQGMPGPLLRTFVNQFVKVSVELGIDVRETGPPVKYATAWNDIERTMGEAVALSKGCQLVLCILPFNSVALYGEIKRVALTLIGVHTQCVQAANVRAHSPKLLTSVALKMNVKLGGFTASIDVGALLGPATMVVSADVNHTTEAGGMSVAAVVTSTDAHGRRYAGTVLQHPQRMEYVENLDAVIRQALRLFHRGTGSKPQRILYYRDGVNDSQMQDVKQLELAAIYHACHLVEPGYRPPVTLVLVRKRHHARFLAHGNPPPGTCVAGGVVSPCVFSFYLLAHRSPFGVSRPAYYLVLHDDSGQSAEDLRRLTYALSFAYPIVTRSVTMPASLYYAHRLTGKGRLQVSRAFNTLPHFTKTPGEQAHLVPVHGALRDSMYFM